ncbi:hypothetical protein U0E23_33095 [Burkholderia stagnalis]|uniref:hypothetical protein n=1 Tax=Burkholderia stagnalis TaxID=1503054 RepID=UPI002AB4EA3E|nr:hypothetical protein [Burkholderia stagnalis]MDY7807273.1 hypothetical protein [Burkholderia stagnalis]
MGAYDFMRRLRRMARDLAIRGTGQAEPALISALKDGIDEEPPRKLLRELLGPLSRNHVVADHRHQQSRPCSPWQYAQAHVNTDIECDASECFIGFSLRSGLPRPGRFFNLPHVGDALTYGKQRTGAGYLLSFP